jgi:streptogrisin C
LQTGASSRCTAGFAAVSGNVGYLIASAACGRPGDTVSSGGSVVGVVAAAQFPPSRVTVTGSAEAAVGASVCKYGLTTGWRCGVIQAKNQTVTFPDGTLTGLTRTSVCAEPGDTGGPFVSGTQAQGVLVGGSGNCAGGGSSYFLPVNRVLAAYRLTILTGTSERRGDGGAQGESHRQAPESVDLAQAGDR